MPPGLRITRSHITTVQASFNPFHPPTSRPLLLLLNLLSVPGKTTTLPSPTTKAAPSPNLNLLVSALPRSATTATIDVGYSDGKIEKFTIGQEVKALKGNQGGAEHPRVRRKAQEVISLGELVGKIDAHARLLKAKEEGVGR